MPDVEAFPSDANFILFRVPNAAVVWRDLLHEHSVLIRDFSRTPGLEGCLRVTVGSEEENARFLGGLAEVLERQRAVLRGGADAEGGADERAPRP